MLLKTSGGYAQIQCLNFFDYEYDEVYIYINQIVDTEYTLRDVCEKENSRQLADFVLHIGSHYRHIIISVFFRSARKSPGTTAHSALEYESMRTDVKEVVPTDIMNGGHSQRAIKFLHEEERFIWIGERCQMHLFMPTDRT